MQRFVEGLPGMKNQEKKSTKTEEIMSKENSLSTLPYKTEDPVLPDSL